MDLQPTQLHKDQNEAAATIPIGRYYWAYQEGGESRIAQRQNRTKQKKRLF
jgi:hypothetical protein